MKTGDKIVRDYSLKRGKQAWATSFKSKPSVDCSASRAPHTWSRGLRRARPIKTCSGQSTLIVARGVANGSINKKENNWASCRILFRPHSREKASKKASRKRKLVFWNENPCFTASGDP